MSLFKTYKFRIKLDIWSKFNLSVVYTKDADIQHYMYAFNVRLTMKESVRVDFAKKKTVKTMAGRQLSLKWQGGLWNELKRYIPVDIHGYCGKGLTCGAYGLLNGSCVSSLLSQYKFYLAFENSFCEDYYTEKIRKTLRVDTIPVVMV